MCNNNGKKTFTTLNNDNNGPYNYKSRNSRLFKGKASVVNGVFSFDFIVPKDIAYNIGTGKVSYYADDNQIDASGGSTDFLIGGTADSVELDDQGPNIEMFLNDKNFWPWRYQCLVEKGYLLPHRYLHLNH